MAATKRADTLKGLSGAPNAQAVSASGPLYVNRVKVYPQRIQGRFRQIKWAVLAFCLTAYYAAPWLRWDRGPGAPDQALLIDLPGRRAYFFGIEIWPQEVYYLTGLLILAAIGLFLVTSLMGRVWCGYACPQTVWTDLYMLVERLIEGDRNARMRLDGQPLDAEKFIRKATKHAAWLLIAAATGGAWVLYFQDAPTALRQMAGFSASRETYFFVGLFTATTYLLAGWAREQVCTYMCPWPRIQAAMLDENSLIVTYQTWRGEPRGKHKQGDSWEGRGDCVDCLKCVVVCPTGIDIRDGQQLECIGCGLCIDACNSVMPLIGRPANLITFDTLANQEAKAKRQPTLYRLVRPRVAIYAAILLIVVGIMTASLLFRQSVDITVVEERNPLYVTMSNGDIRNGYTIKILNKSHMDRAYALSVEGVGDGRLSAIGATSGAGGSVTLSARPDSVAAYRVYLAAPRTDLTGGTTPIAFALRDKETGELVRHKSVFLGPNP